jgi:hypothetical protein
MLSRHPEIKSAGELPTMAECTLRLPSLSAGIAYPMAAQHMTPETVTVLTEQYLARLSRGMRPSIRYIIDKHPLNFRYLGLIAKLFPHARILHCSRDPLDTCLSNYFQFFAGMYDYSFDLKNIGHFYHEYERYMAHWRDALRMEIHDVRYEDMVGDTETTARRVLDFLGLEWDERCLSPQKNPQAVHTCSMAQVRQPITQKSVGRWRHYEKHLGELKEILEWSEKD